jgi:hypothetical protein
LGQFSKNYIELFTQKILTKHSKIWVWDPGSEIRDPEKTHSGSGIPDPGVKKPPDPGSGSATLGTIFFLELQIWIAGSGSTSGASRGADISPNDKNLVAGSSLKRSIGLN